MGKGILAGASGGGGTNIPVTSDPADNVQIWIDPNEEDQNDGFYTKTETEDYVKGYAAEKNHTHSLESIGAAAVDLSNVASSAMAAAIAAAGGGGAKIATGSMAGTNKNGASNPSSVTFDFAPKFVFFVYKRSNQLYFGGHTGGSIGASMAVPMDCVTTDYKSICAPGMVGFSPDTTMTKKSSDGKTLYWYNTTNAVGQFNETGCTLFYIAIG